MKIKSKNADLVPDIKTQSRKRATLKKLSLGTASVLAIASLDKWSQPVLRSVITPAHAQMSDPVEEVAEDPVMDPPVTASLGPLTVDCGVNLMPTIAQFRIDDVTDSANPVLENATNAPPVSNETFLQVERTQVATNLRIIVSIPFVTTLLEVEIDCGTNAITEITNNLAANNIVAISSDTFTGVAIVSQSSGVLSVSIDLTKN